MRAQLADARAGAKRLLKYSASFGIAERQARALQQQAEAYNRPWIKVDMKSPGFIAYDKDCVVSAQQRLQLTNVGQSVATDVHFDVNITERKMVQCY